MFDIADDIHNMKTAITDNMSMTYLDASDKRLEDSFAEFRKSKGIKKCQKCGGSMHGEIHHYLCSTCHE